MKNILLIILTITCIYNANAQTWTNYHDGYKKNYCLAMTDSLIFVGCDRLINVYSTEGVYKYSKRTDGDVYSSSIDNEGNIWFSNKFNLLKFDGENWSTYRPDISEDMECSTVTCDKSNNIWATFSSYSTDDACVSKFDGINWQNYSTFGDTITITNANQIVIDTNNVVYIGIDVDGNNWFYGIVRISATDTTIFHYGNSDCSIAWQHSSYLDKNNNVWFGGGYNDLLRYDGTDWFREGDDAELHNKSFYAIFMDTADNLWLGTPTGLFVKNEDSWIEYNEENELELDYIWDIKSDEDNNIWMAASPNPNYSGSDANNGCLIKYNETGFTHYYPNTFRGEPQKIVFRNDEIWVKSGDAVSIFKDGAWHINEIDETIPYSNINDMVVDSDNNIWLATSDALYKININNNIEAITNILGHDLLGNRSLAALEDNIWLNFSSYLLKFDGQNWIEIDITGLPTTYFNKIQPVNSNEIWVGTNSGAMHYIDGEWHSYTETEGLGSNTVRDIAVEDNNIWFATSSGVSVFDGVEFTTYIQDSAIIANYNSNTSIHIDKKGHKWVGCPKGIYRFDNYNFHFMQPNDIDELINYITEDADGNVWVAGRHGLSKYTFAPANIENNLVNKTALEFYPNPATNDFNIILPKGTINDIVEIYSTTGSLVLQQKVQTGTNNIN
ncbi:MAG: hypothetical protein JXR36_16150, partial [Bacteroidales bacterium]|nr:hypothetical protein [Bacteroidales bacterium]